MCRQGCSRESAERPLNAEINIQTYNQNYEKQSLRDRAEFLLATIENDYTVDQQEIAEYKEQLLNAIDDLEQTKQQNMRETEQTKLEIIGVLKTYFEKQESEWSQKLAIVNDLIGLLKHTQEQLSTEAKNHHDAYTEYCKLIDKANDDIRKANLRIEQLNRGFSR